MIGVPDDEWGERVVAFVVAVPGAGAPTLDELRAFAREQLSAPKLPREVRVVDAIPRTRAASRCGGCYARRAA